eukprot:9721603-Prorocentrum_lima.AAC.1
MASKITHAVPIAHTCLLSLWLTVGHLEVGQLHPTGVKKQVVQGFQHLGCLQPGALLSLLL